MNILIKITWLVLSITMLQNSIFSQKTSVVGNSISVDMDVFEALSEWSAKGEQQEVPMDEFLTSKFSNEKIKPLLEKFKSGGDNQRPECICQVVTPNVTFDLSPSTQQTYTHNSGSGNNYRKYSRTRHGAAHKDVLELKGKHQGRNYSATTSGTTNSSTTYTRFDVLWVCSSGSYPSNCGCDKIIEFDAKYESRLCVDTRVGGIWSKAAFASAEETASIFSFDWLTDPNDRVNNVVVHSVGYDGYKSQKQSTWNPQAFVKIVDLGATIGKTILGSSLTSAQIDSLKNKVNAIITTPFSIKNMSGGDGCSTFSTQSSSVIALKPNLRKTISIVSNGSLYGRGYGGNWDSKASVSSDYSMAIVIPFDNSKPWCCIEQIAAWDAKAMSGAPNNLATLKSGMKSFINARSIPSIAMWGPNWMTSTMNLSLYSTGYIHDLLTTDGGRSASSNCIPWIFPWWPPIISANSVEAYATVSFSFPYPNPIVNIGLNNPQNGTTMIFEEFEIIPSNPYEHTFDLAGFEPGTYELFVTTFDGEIHTALFDYYPEQSLEISVNTEPADGAVAVQIDYSGVELEHLDIIGPDGVPVISEALAGNEMNPFLSYYDFSLMPSGNYMVEVSTTDGLVEMMDFFWTNSNSVTVSASPNPTNGLVTIKIENPVEMELESVLIFSSQSGEMVDQYLIPPDIEYPYFQDYDLSFVFPGIYQIVVQASNGAQFSTTVIVQQ